MHHTITNHDGFYRLTVCLSMSDIQYNTQIIKNPKSTWKCIISQSGSSGRCFSVLSDESLASVKQPPTVPPT